MPPHRYLAHLAQNLGPIIHLRLGRVPTIVVSSAHLAKLVLKTHDHVFASRPQLVAAQWLSFGCSDITFSPYGSYWRQARKICVTELLISKRVSSFQQVREEEVNRLLTQLASRSGSAVDMSKILFALTNNVLCRVAVGRRFILEEESESASKSKSEDRLAELLTETQALLAGWCVGDFFPEWDWVNWVSGLRRRLKRNLEGLRQVCDEIIDEHMKTKTTSDKGGREDFVDVLLRVKQRDDLEVPITDDNLKALVLDMFVAGTDTTSATLEWTMTELARHPKVMKKAQEQVRKIASATGSQVDETDLQHLPYLKAVIKETMRLHPPVPLLVPRESMESCILDGYEVPARTRVLINAYAIARDPESWDDPLEFRPERFEEEAGDKDRQFKFLPFGGGRRGCPGYAFGLATVEIALARLLCLFDWALPQGVGPDDLDMDEIFGLATRKKCALVLVPTATKDYQL